MSKPKRSRVYTEEDLQFIRDNWQDLSDKKMADHLGVKPGGVRNARKKMRLIKFIRREWTEKQDQILRDYYPTTEINEVQKMLGGRTRSSIYGRVSLLGIHKNPDYLLEQNRGLGAQLAKCEKAVKNRYPKGHTPENKGLKKTDYMSREAIEKTKKTRFKKGHSPVNTKWDGAISCRVDSKGTPYMHIRVAKAKWDLLHRHNWKKKNGSIPKGHLLRCKDGNTMNCMPSNWELITRGEHACRNVNREKAAAALKKFYKEHGHPAVDLHDSYVAGHLVGGDKELREYLIEHRQDLIRVARKRYLLNRKLKQIEDEQNK